MLRRWKGLPVCQLDWNWLRLCVCIFICLGLVANFVLSNVEGYSGESRKKNIRNLGMWVIYSIGMEFFTMFSSLGKYSLVIHKRTPILVWE